MTVRLDAAGTLIGRIEGQGARASRTFILGSHQDSVRNGGMAAVAMASPAQAEDKRIALVVKALGIGFFEAAAKGAEEAAKELGGVEIIYTGPTDTTAEGQIEVINALIAQKVDAIAISANDQDALVPALKKAMPTIRSSTARTRT